MNDSGNHTLRRVGSDPNDSCRLHSHAEHDAQACDIVGASEIVTEASRGQIHIAVATAVTGLAASFIFDLALIHVWYHHAMAGLVMPSVPWFITSIAMAVHAAGGVSAMKIPRKPRIRIGVNG